MDRDTEALGAGAISKFSRQSLLTTSSTIADHRVPNYGERASGQDNIIEPEDSISMHGYQQSRISTSSSRSSESRTSSHRALAIKREIELTAQATMIRKRQEIEARKRELQRRLEEDWKREQLEVEAQLEAARAYTQILHERTGDTSSSLVSVTTDAMARSIINRAKEEEEQTRRKTTLGTETAHPVTNSVEAPPLHSTSNVMEPPPAHSVTNMTELPPVPSADNVI